MGLVQYSDSGSDDSDAEVQTTLKPTPNPVKQTFQKVVDRSNPSKIRVNLASIAPTKIDDSPEEERPAKKARLASSGGRFSGINSFLPPPKRSGEAISEDKKKPGLGKGLGRGVNLKTGAAPAFSRTPQDAAYAAQSEGDLLSNGAQTTPGTLMNDLPTEVKLVGKATVFRPLSVARKQQRKKPLTASMSSIGKASSTTSESKPTSISQVPTEPKISLFSISQPEQTFQEPPLIPDESFEPEMADEAAELSQHDLIPHEQPIPVAQTPQTLDTIASSMQLDAASRRQLFGRQAKAGGLPVDIINFNTDQEYAHNEVIRATGETVQHNAVRAIAPGKHSLKQLVNQANSQKEAFEDAWAAGRQNKKASGNKYGW